MRDLFKCVCSSPCSKVFFNILLVNFSMDEMGKGYFPKEDNILLFHMSHFSFDIFSNILGYKISNLIFYYFFEKKKKK